ncbi:metal dependent phosphohydrolase [Candidatus Moduliflexus flocculans]|uniref:Metal dependent phosphohydrolase n=1 Tax=Candidatus Moduliflexus flocculans TaxID=1499966 RepID=A0A0S6W5D9_9BACT|nr:metal dependent phosphohydrolase [Candidatus Moduliflexus flocculans]
MLMDAKPGDYDIVTNAAPEQVARIFKRTVPVGAQFGVILVVIKGVKFEVAQFRNISGDSVEAWLREDVQHRDLTINGMAYDPLTEQIFDYVGGQEDIQRRIIRGIGEPRDRFLEDRLRMLRAIRFAVRFGYELDPATFAAIQELAPDIQEVSVERIREELLKILTSPQAERGVRLLDDSGMLPLILPEVAALKGVTQPPEFHPEGDVFTHTLLMLRQMKHPSPELAMATLLHDVGKPATRTVTDRIRFHQHELVGADIAENICLRLKFSTDAIEKITTLVREHQKFSHAQEMKTSTLKRFLRQKHFADLLELHRLDRMSSYRQLESYHFCKAKLKEFAHDNIHPPRLISGDDLVKLGFAPGPVFKRVLEAVEDAQLEGTVTTREQALAYAKEFQATGISM